MSQFTIIDATRDLDVEVTIDGERVRLAAAALQAALGWELKPQGLCKDDLCVPVGHRPDLVTAQGVDLAAFSALIDRPLAIDLDEKMACLGVSATTRATQLSSLDAPDFTLPDYLGRPHSLSQYRGKKVLLVAYASW